MREDTAVEAYPEKRRGDCRDRKSAELGASAAKIVLAVTMLSLGGCAIFRPFPELPAQQNPSQSFQSAIDYAVAAQKSYHDWLVTEYQTNLFLGTTAIGFGGAALAMVTAGASTAAVGAIGAAGGTTIAADQWIVGSPGKDPRVKAYTTAIFQLQCVINNAWSAKPRLDAGFNQNSSAIAPNDVLMIARYVKGQGEQLNATADKLSGEIKAPNETCKVKNESEIAGANLVIARAIAASHRASVIAASLNEAPTDIVNAVNVIDQNAFAQAGTGGPDPSNIPKVSSLAGKASEGKTSKTGIKGQYTKKDLRRATPPESACAYKFRELQEGVMDTTRELETLLSSAVPPQPGFAECLKSPPPSSNPDMAGVAGPMGRSTMHGPLTILPGLQLVARQDQPLNISISGGRPPYSLIAVDPGLSVTQKAGSGSAAADVQVTVDSMGETRRLLVTDVAGAWDVVYVDPALPKK